ncbi:MAG: Fic family protein [Gammaproteobacteria bacterium]|nr:Fic family protein [Gammaproteobacteria bacterium]
MHRGLQGRYRTVRIPGVFENHKAFLPAPLPPAPALRIRPGSALFDLNTQASEALAQTETFWHSLDHRAILVSAFVCREAVLTSMIDQSHVRLRELLYWRAHTGTGRQAQTRTPVLDVSRCVSATQFAHQALNNRHAIDLDLLLDAHKVLVDGEGAGDGRVGGEGAGDGRVGGEGIASDHAQRRRSGQLRGQQNWLGTEMRLRTGRPLFDITYVPPPPKVIGAQMQQLLSFVNDDTVAVSPLLRTGLVHAQFENIHPFDDGSGRVGRILISMMLAHYQLLSWPVLCLSEYLFEHRPLYRNQLDRLRLDGDWETWLEFFLTGIIECCDASRATARSLNTLLEEDHAFIEDSSDALKRTHRALLGTGVASIEILARKARLTRNNTTDCLMQLCKLDIATPYKPVGQDQLYYYRHYIDIIEVGLPEDDVYTE